jgi:type I restriction enzyme, S subunit
VSFPRLSLEALAESVDYGVTASAKASAVGPKFLRITDIQDERVDWPTVPYCEATPAQLDGARLEDGDIVFARTGATTGKSYMLRTCPERAVFASYLIRVRPNRAAVDPRYLAWYFKTPDYWRQISSSASGTAQPGVNATKLKSLSVPAPTLPQQRRIADILDKADAVRRKRTEAISLTEELLRSAFLGMFGDPVTNSKGWPVRPLGDVADIASGVTKGKRYDGVRMTSVPYMRVANVQDGHLVLDDVTSITVSEDDARRYLLRRGDVLLTEGGDPDKLGRGAVWHGEVPNCIHQNHIFRVRVSSELLPDYISALIGSQRGKRYFLGAAKQTTGIASINMTQLKAFPALLPPREMQQRYVDVLQRMQNAREHQRAAAAGLGALLGSLVQLAFRGELGAM